MLDVRLSIKLVTSFSVSLEDRIRVRTHTDTNVVDIAPYESRTFSSTVRLLPVPNIVTNVGSRAGALSTDLEEEEEEEEPRSLNPYLSGRSSSSQPLASRINLVSNEKPIGGEDDKDPDEGGALT
jgi:hypothetical protein